MRALLYFILFGAVVSFCPQTVRAQAPGAFYPSEQPEVQRQTPEAELGLLQQTLADLRNQLAAAQGAGQQDDKLQKRVDLLQKQIETQQKMIEVLLENVKKQPPAGATVEKLQIQVATLQARSQQAAQRDQDVTQAIDNLTEHMDAEERHGPRLPYTLKGLFQDFEPEISPLLVTGDIGFRFDKIGSNASDFNLQNFAPIFLYQLRDNWLLSVEPEIFTDRIEMEYARLDWLVNDWLNIGAGRMLLPFGQFNERLRQKWISKLPIRPLVFLQVLPETLSQDGVQARGASYLFDWPVKFEYAAWVTDGFSLGVANPTFTDYANLRAMNGVFRDISDPKSPGGRAGLVFPELGVYTGASYWFNPDYDNRDSNLHFWGLDYLWHWQSWDLRFEGVWTHQDVPARQDIERYGFYVQLAYRAYDAPWLVAKNLEYVFEYGWTGFSGIPPGQLTLSRFSADPRNAPVNRHEYTLGINYYFSPSLLLQFAYEINDETGPLELNDNAFASRLVWGF